MQRRYKKETSSQQGSGAEPPETHPWAPEVGQSRLEDWPAPGLGGATALWVYLHIFLYYDQVLLFKDVQDGSAAQKRRYHYAPTFYSVKAGCQKLMYLVDRIFSFREAFYNLRSVPHLGLAEGAGYADHLLACGCRQVGEVRAPGFRQRPRPL